jgi:hypothetical protein
MADVSSLSKDPSPEQVGAHVVEELHDHLRNQSSEDIFEYLRHPKTGSDQPNSPDRKAIEQYVQLHGFPDFSTSDSGTINFVGTEGSAGLNSHPFKPADITGVGADGIDQGSHSDCWFEAALASVASTNQGQKQIANMIVQNPDRSYTVTFPGNKNTAVTVTMDDIKKFGEADYKDGWVDYADWSQILQTAMNKEAPDAMEHGGSGALALHLLTGSQVNEDSSEHGISSADGIAGNIQESLRSGNPIIALSIHPKDGQDPTAGPVVKEHYYTVTGYDPATKSITLRNPWGWNNQKSGSTVNGVTDLGNAKIKMSLDTFMEQYREIAYVPLHVVYE